MAQFLSARSSAIRLLLAASAALLLALPAACSQGSSGTPVRSGAGGSGGSGGATTNEGGGRDKSAGAGKERGGNGKDGGRSFGGGMRNGSLNERPTPVEVATVRTGRISRQLRSSGRLQARSQVTVTSGVSGQILQVGVEVGAHVVRQVPDESGSHLVLARLPLAEAIRMATTPPAPAPRNPEADPAPVLPPSESPALPAELIGFAGMLTGRVVQQWNTGMVLDITGVPRSWAGSRAVAPKRAVGRRVRVEVRHDQRGSSHVPSDLMVRWVASLKPGQVVAVDVRNDLLARFDDELFVYAMREAETTVKLRQAEAAQRELALTKARADLDRAFRAIEGGSELDERIFTREQLDALRLAVDTASTELDVANLNQRQADVALERARRDLRACRVASPIDGVVVTRHIKPYDRVNAGDPLFDVADPHDLLLYVYLTEGEASNVRAGQGATIASRGQQTFAYPAFVEQVAPAVDQERGLVEVRLNVVPWRDLQALGMWGRTQQLMRLVAGPGGMMPTARVVGPGTTPPLKPGMFVAVQIATAVHENAVLCPKEALQYERDRPYVFRVTRDNRAEQVWIRMRSDFASWDDVEVESGLAEGDTVVVRQSDLQNGNAVTVISRR